MGLQQVGLELVIKATGDAQQFLESLGTAVTSLQDDVVALANVLDTSLKPALEAVTKTASGVAEAFGTTKKEAEDAAGALALPGVAKDLEAVQMAAEGITAPLTSITTDATSAATALAMPGVAGDIGAVMRAEEGVATALQTVTKDAEGVTAAVEAQAKAAEGAAVALEMSAVPGAIEAVARSEQSVAMALESVIKDAEAATVALESQAKAAEQAAAAGAGAGGVPGAGSGPGPGGGGGGGSGGGANAGFRTGAHWMVGGMIVSQAGQDLATLSATATDFGKQFEKIMNDVATNVGASKAQVDSWASDILAMSSTIPVAPEELAKGLYTVVAAGYKGTEAIDVLRESARMATGGLTDMTSATDTITSVLAAYNLPATEAGHVSDILFKTMAQGKFHLSEFNGELGKMLPLAAAGGVPLEELGAAMDTLRLKGMPTAQAATAIENALKLMVDPTKASQTEARQLGITLGGAALASKGFAGMMQEIADKTHGNVEAMAKLDPNIRGLNAILLMSKDGMAAYNGHLAGLRDVSGAASEAVDIQNRSLMNQEQITRNVGAASSYATYQQMVPGLEAADQAHRSALKTWNQTPDAAKGVVGWFSEIGGGALKLAGNLMTGYGTAMMLKGLLGTAGLFGGGAAAAGGAAAGGAAAGAAGGAAAAGAGALAEGALVGGAAAGGVEGAGALAAAAGPPGWIAAAVVAIGVGVYEIIKHWDTLKASTQKIWGETKAWLGNAWGSITEVASAAWGSLTQVASSVWKSVAQAFSAGFSAVGAFFTQTLPTWLGAFAKWGSDTLESLGQWFASLPESLAHGIGYVAGWLSVKIPQAWTAITTWLSDAGHAFVQFWADLPGKIAAGIEAIGTWLGQKISAGWTAITSWLSDAGTSVVQFFTELPGKLAAGIEAIGIWLGQTISKAWSAIDSWLANEALELAKWFAGLPGKFVGWINSIGTAITGAWHQFLDWGTSLAEHLWSAFTGFISNAIHTWIPTMVSDAINAIKSAVGGALDFGKKIIDSVTGGFKEGQADAGGVPSHADGGFFRIPHLAVVGDTSEGEYVVNRSNARQFLPAIAAWAGMAGGRGAPAPAVGALAPLGGGGGVNQTIHQIFHVTGNMARSEDDLAEMVASKLWEMMKRRSSVPTFEVG